MDPRMKEKVLAFLREYAELCQRHRLQLASVESGTEYDGLEHELAVIPLNDKDGLEIVDSFAATKYRQPIWLEL